MTDLLILQNIFNGMKAGWLRKLENEVEDLERDLSDCKVMNYPIQLTLMTQGSEPNKVALIFAWCQLFDDDFEFICYYVDPGEVEVFYEQIAKLVGSGLEEDDVQDACEDDGVKTSIAPSDVKSFGKEIRKVAAVINQF